MDNVPQFDRHFHWSFLASNTLDDPKVLVEVIGYEKEDDALIAAKAMVNRQIYSLHTVRECTNCGYQAHVAMTLKKMTA